MIVLIKALREEFGPQKEPQGEWWEKLAPYVPDTLQGLAALGQARATQLPGLAATPGAAQPATPRCAQDGGASNGGAAQATETPTPPPTRPTR